ncbi:MAG TPA: glycosyltransferase family 4 protein [Bacillota bacterium]|nr:glycosyltransferase family 4 protein [Bacillota bacterium]
MKIAMIGQKGIPALTGGVERHVDELSTRLVKQGHQVTVFCRSTYSKDRYLDHEGVRLKYITTLNHKSLEAVVYSFLASVTALFQDYDLIHYHALGPASLSFIPKLLQRKTVVTVHGLDWQRDKWGKAAKLYLKFGETVTGKISDQIISVAEPLCNYFIEKYQRTPDNVGYIPNGVNFYPAREPDEIRKYGLDKENYLLFLARLVPEKGVHYLIEAYRQSVTDKKLVIAGGSSHSDDYVSRLRKMADGNSNIIFIGNVQGKVLQELYSNAYLYVLPSDLEGMPISLLEAMSYSRCCLVSDIPENMQVVKSNYGFSFIQADPDSLKAKIEFLLENPHLVAQTGQRAFEEAKFNYNWDAIVEKTLQLYRSVLQVG